MEARSALAGVGALSRSQHSAEDIRDELERVAASFSASGEDLELGFHLPQPAAPDWPFPHNWDVAVAVPEGLEDLAFRTIDAVASRWDLQQR